MKEEFNQIVVNITKCKIIFLINGIKKTNDIKAVARKYKRELNRLTKELQEYISQKEYQNFFSDILEIPLQNAVEEAENIIKNRGFNNGRN